LSLEPGIYPPRLGLRNAGPPGVPFSFDVDAVVDFRGPRHALVAERHEIALHINHLGRQPRLLHGLSWERRRVAPDKIDEMEARQPFHEVAPDVLAGPFARLSGHEGTRLFFAEPCVILVVRVP